MITLENISFKIPEHDNMILHHMDYHISPHDFVIVLGSNGSGKSSLLKLLDRRYHLSSGKIFINQKPMLSYSNNEFSKTVVTLTQNCNESLFTSLTLFENYLLVKQKYEKGLFSLASKKEKIFFGEYLQGFNRKLSDKMDVQVEKLSGGEKQALALALAVLYPPKILLLDEHTSALDPNSAQQIMELTKEVVRKNQITCLLTTHDLNIASEYGNRILALKNGKIHQKIEMAEKEKLTTQEMLAVCY
ncbi:MAG TPA: ATP-binding cassette domain-containing protein [Gammaproteobacteria bacterium]|nr:ATP-binding cassette domain-containing protein [Gammaproteobacteria bacterium]